MLNNLDNNNDTIFSHILVVTWASLICNPCITTTFYWCNQFSTHILTNIIPCVRNFSFQLSNVVNLEFSKFSLDVIPLMLNGIEIRRLWGPFQNPDSTFLEKMCWFCSVFWILALLENVTALQAKFQRRLFHISSHYVLVAILVHDFIHKFEISSTRRAKATQHHDAATTILQLVVIFLIPRLPLWFWTL